MRTVLWVQRDATIEGKFVTFYAGLFILRMVHYHCLQSRLVYYLIEMSKGKYQHSRGVVLWNMRWKKVEEKMPIIPLMEKAAASITKMKWNRENWGTAWTLQQNKLWWKPWNECNSINLPSITLMMPIASASRNLEQTITIKSRITSWSQRGSAVADGCRRHCRIEMMDRRVVRIRIL